MWSNLRDPPAIVCRDHVLLFARRYYRVTEIFIDGCFVEDREHPIDIDGCFICDLRRLASADLQREIKLLNSFQIWTWNPAMRRPYRGYP